MRLDLNRYQRAALLVAAAAIVFVQFAQFSNDGVDGSGWIVSFLAAGALVVVALAARRLYAQVAQRLPATATPSKAELDASHAGLRENAEILAVEVEQRAANLANALREQTDTVTTAVVSVMPGMGVFSEALDLHIQERCLCVMLGLIGMRRSKGRQTYITGIEFKTLQKRVSKNVMETAVAAHISTPLPEANPQALQKALMDDLQQVRRAITSYCVALESGQTDPEDALLVWFQSKTSIRLQGHPQVAKALRQKDE